MEEHGWFEASVGSPDQWPPLLRTTFSLCRHAPLPMAVLWGSDHLLLYNDAFAEVLGDDHPQVFAQPAKTAWPADWDDLRPILDRAWRGTASQNNDRQILLYRDHRAEECHFTQWFSPITDHDGTVHGVLIVAHETTLSVLTARRRRLLSHLAGGIGVAADVREACALAMRAVAPNHPDMPFGIMYFMDADRSCVTRLGSVPEDVSAEHFPRTIDLDHDQSDWPILEAAESGRPVCVDRPNGLEAPSGPWKETPRQIVFVPILLRGVVDEPCGILVAGLNPYRPYDADYEDFFDQLSSRMASAITTAMSRQAAFAERVAGVRRRRLADAAPLISARQSRHQLLHQLANQARLIIGAHHAAAALKVDGTPARAVAAISSSGDSKGPQISDADIIEVDPTVIASPARRPAILQADDILHDAPLRRFLEAIDAPQPIDKLLVTPIDGRSDARWGLIVVCNPFDRDFGAQEADVIGALAVLSAVALENAEYDERLRRAYAAREEVLAIVSHDLRNPLNTVALALEVLLHVDLDPGQQRKRLEVAQRAVGLANRLIDDVLDAALLEAGQIKVTPEATDVHQILASVADQMRPIVEINELDLVVRADDDFPAVRADPARLIQILQNLVGNAVKVMREGTITVTARAEDEEAVTFRVTDMGPGIPLEEKKHVFTRYWRGSRSPRKSAGLGLAIAHGLVERHRGKIWVESAEGGGATFAFTIPMVERVGPRENSISE